MKLAFLFIISLTASSIMSDAQQTMKPEETEQWTPVPKMVTPAKSFSTQPSDAIVLFDGKNLDQWVSVSNGGPAGWTVADGIMTVNKKTGNIQSKQSFSDYQMHLEWKVPATITGSGQARGNSGLFLASTGKGDDGYEIQIMDSYNNATYVNGQAGAIYKQNAPLVNPINPPGEWNVYDIVWTAPRFNADGSLKSAARVTAFFNGILIQNNFELPGPTQYIGHPSYTGKAHGPSPVKLQSHGDPSEPISFRNIWIRPL
ncbi:MAG: hypothetical protein JWN76_2758 [Chitinophagaceae bacterium]|nr:hypothetical protein [Chitinophagaceae bacterium]